MEFITKEFTVCVHPCLELINSILLTSKYNEITKPFVGYGLMSEAENEYTAAVTSFFYEYRHHQIYGKIEAMIPYGFTFSRPVEIALCLGASKDLILKYNPSDLCVRYSGGMECIQEFLGLLRQFADETKYFSFFGKAVRFYAPILEKVEKKIREYPFISMLEQEYGKEQGTYNYVVTTLMKGNFGIHFIDAATQKTDMFSVFSTDDFSLSPAVLFHEYSHPYINPLTEKYSKIADGYYEAYELLQPYKLPDYLSGYGDWQECINEHFVRSMAVHLMKKCRLDKEAEQLLQNDLDRGYKYMPLILERYEFYDSNRDKYIDFESFYPELLKVFSHKI